MTLKEYAARVEARLNELLPGGGAVVNDAMRYSVMAGGKRLRPAMLLAAADDAGRSPVRRVQLAVIAQDARQRRMIVLVHDVGRR